MKCISHNDILQSYKWRSSMPSKVVMFENTGSIEVSRAPASGPLVHIVIHFTKTNKVKILQLHINTTKSIRICGAYRAGRQQSILTQRTVFCGCIKINIK